LQHAEHFNRRLSELNVKTKESREQKTENVSLAEKLNQKTEEKIEEKKEVI
jgi:hypothetical protein